jgi:hypothetical protein
VSWGVGRAVMGRRLAVQAAAAGSGKTQAVGESRGGGGS